MRVQPGAGASLRASWLCRPQVGRQVLRVWLRSAGDPNCVHIPGLTLEANRTYTLVVSDKDDLDAVLPVGIVRSLLARARARPAAALPLPRCAELGPPAAELSQGAILR